MIALAGALFAPFATHRLALWRERRTNLAASHAEFCGAFSEAVLNLTESDVPSAQVVHAFRVRHLAAIQGFRGRVPWFKRSGFDKAVEAYRQCCDKCLEGGIFAVAASESNDYANSNRKALLESIHDLLSYAKEA